MGHTRVVVWRGRRIQQGKFGFLFDSFAFLLCFCFFFLFFSIGRESKEEMQTSGMILCLGLFTFANQAFGADDDEADLWCPKLAWKGWTELELELQLEGSKRFALLLCRCQCACVRQCLSAQPEKKAKSPVSSSLCLLFPQTTVNEEKEIILSLLINQSMILRSAPPPIHRPVQADTTQADSLCFKGLSANLKLIINPGTNRH